jgi:hypothetical protein
MNDSLDVIAGGFKIILFGILVAAAYTFVHTFVH